MKLRKYLVVGAAVLTAGLLTLQTGTAQATGGGTVNHIEIGGVVPLVPAAVTGAFKSGTATFAGFTAGCVGGSIGGTVGTSPRFDFNSLNIVCDTPLGIDSNISYASGCAIGAAASDSHVHDGLVDGQDPKGGKYAPVTFNPFVVASKCVIVSMAGGCTFRVDGTIDVQFVEPPKTVSGVQYQDLVFKGSGLTTRNANFLCFGLYPNGSTIVLNDITFNLRTTSGGLIDFRPV